VTVDDVDAAETAVLKLGATSLSSGGVNCGSTPIRPASHSASAGTRALRLGRSRHWSMPDEGRQEQGGGVRKRAAWRNAMMYWGNGMGGWGVAVMTVSSLLFWGLVIAGIVVLVRYLSRAGQAGRPTLVRNRTRSTAASTRKAMLSQVV